MQLTLNEKTRMPMIGFGIYLIDNDAVQPLVLEALHTVYRRIDTAEAYGNEQGVGITVRSGMQDLGLTRDDVFVASKLWCGNDVCLISGRQTQNRERLNFRSHQSAHCRQHP